MSATAALAMSFALALQGPTNPPVEAPDSVTEGSTIPVQTHDGSDRIYVFNTRTKSLTEHQLNPDGSRDIPLPPDAQGGDVLIILTSSKKKGPKNGAIVEIRPSRD